MHPSGKDLEVLAALVDAQQIDIVVGQVFPFEKIKEAFAYLEGGNAKGKSCSPRLLLSSVTTWRRSQVTAKYCSRP